MYTRLAVPKDYERIRQIYKGRSKHTVVVSENMHKEAIEKGLIYVYDNGTIWGYLRVKRISGALQIEEILLNNMTFVDETIAIKSMIEHVVSSNYKVVSSKQMEKVIKENVSEMEVEEYHGKTCIRYVQ
jgi:hypothetical protein